MILSEPIPNDLAAAPPRSSGRARTVLGVAALVALAVIIASLAAVRMRGYRYPVDFRAAWLGVRSTLSTTVPAALAVWTVLAIVIASVAGWLGRRDPSLAANERVAGAIVLFWSATYVALLTLGPIGLYRPFVLRSLLLVAVGALVAHALGARRTSGVTPEPRRRRPSWSSGMRPWPTGPWIAAIAMALAFVPLLLMQLGSPVSPFMDILPYVASTEKIVTFHFYDPFGNDAAGIWAPSRQLAGCNAPYSFLALVAGTRGHLAMTALIVPMGAFAILGLYLLGRSTQGSLTGGMATLFLLQTFVWRRTPDVRGTSIAFPLVAIGLAFLVARRRGGVRIALGGLALGLAVAVNPLIGATGMQVAAGAILLGWLDLARALLAPMAALAAGSLFALPQVFIGLGRQVPPWLLAIAAIAGAGCLLVVSRSAIERAGGGGRRSAFARLAVIGSLPLTVLWFHAHRRSDLFRDDWFGCVPLVVMGFAGLVVAAREVWRHPARWPGIAMPAVALWIGFANHWVADPLRFQGAVAVRSLASEVTTKMVHYWWPYWLALAAGVAFAMVARRWARVPVLLFTLFIVIYPVRYESDSQHYDTAQLSLAEAWSFQLNHAAIGYFAGHPDRRWVLDDQWRSLERLLQGEIAAGRIGYETHVVQITPAINSVELALTGVSVDLVTPEYDPNSIWTIGGRSRPLQEASAILRARPQYVLVQDYPTTQFPELAAYDELMATPLFRFYRVRETAAPSAPVS